MPDGIYDRDILRWADQQAALLRRLAAGERVNAEVDWPHVIEELQDVGLSELRACESLLRQAIVHLLKLHAWPDGPAAHWRGETVGFLADAAARFTPSMRQRIDLDRLYRRACGQVEAQQDHPGALDVPAACPWSLDDLLTERTDLPALLSRLTASPPPA